MRPPSAEKPVEYLSREEVVTLLATADADMKPNRDVLMVAVRLGVIAGLRCGEMYASSRSRISSVKCSSTGDGDAPRVTTSARRSSMASGSLPVRARPFCGCTAAPTFRSRQHPGMSFDTPLPATS